MFRTWRADAKRLLKPGLNTLLIRFRSPINEVLPLMAKLNYQLPAANDQGEKTSPYTRKAPYQYGWDWGPRFVTSGVWRPVRLEAWDGARIADFHVAQKGLTREAAEMGAVVELVADTEADATVVVDDPADGKRLAERAVRLRPGTNRVALD